MPDWRNWQTHQMNNPPLSQLAEEMSLKLIKSEFKSLKGDHPLYKSPIWKIYGPYQRDDLRRHIIAYDGQTRKTISYPKFIMECKLNRLLENNEEVHHKNEIEFDDRLDNYEVINGTTHRNMHISEPEVFLCPVCKVIFSLKGVRLSNYKSNKLRKPTMKGPYCSRSCSSKENN